MLKAKFLMLFVAIAAAGCLTEGQFLASRQPTAMQVAVSRGQSAMNCPSATGELLSQEFTQAIQTPIPQAGYSGNLRSALRVADSGGSIRFFARWRETVVRRSKVGPSERDSVRRFRVSGVRFQVSK